jgi:hypothetical protein
MKLVGQPLADPAKERKRKRKKILFVLSFLIGAFVIDGTVEDGALEGKLSCIHCGARLGYFNWSGIQCNCGSWITPAFQISKSKVDISTT